MNVINFKEKNIMKIKKEKYDAKVIIYCYENNIYYEYQLKVTILESSLVKANNISFNILSFNNRFFFFR